MEKALTGLLDEVLHFLSTMQGVCGTQLWVDWTKN